MQQGVRKTKAFRTPSYSGAQFTQRKWQSPKVIELESQYGRSILEILLRHLQRHKTIAPVAVRLGVDQSTLCRWVSAHNLVRTQVKHRFTWYIKEGEVLIPESKVQEYLRLKDERTDYEKELRRVKEAVVTFERQPEVFKPFMPYSTHSSTDLATRALQWYLAQFPGGFGTVLSLYETHLQNRITHCNNEITKLGIQPEGTP